MPVEQIAISGRAGDGPHNDPPGHAVDVYLSRFRGLTPRQVRLLILVVQDGLGYRELSATLGITRSNVATTMQSVRRKLAVPRHQDLACFVRSIPSLSAVFVSDEATEAANFEGEDARRRQDLLRMTIDDMKAVAVRARRRAASLERLPIFDDDAATRSDEIRTIRRVAELADVAVFQALTEARQT